jgi:hypothetical protein
MRLRCIKSSSERTPHSPFVETSAKASRQRKLSILSLVVGGCVYQLMNWRAGWEACDGSVTACVLGYNEFDLFLENKEYRPFDGCKIEI